MELKPIVTKPLQSEALIRIYPGKITLSRRACTILCISLSWPRVFIREDGAHRVYISHSHNGKGYQVYQRKGAHTGQICSSDLSSTLAVILGGYGTYRISEDDVIFYDGISHYQIISAQQ